MMTKIKNSVNLRVLQKVSSFSFPLLGKMPEAKGAVSVLNIFFQHRGTEFTELHREIRAFVAKKNTHLRKITYM